MKNVSLNDINALNIILASKSPRRQQLLAGMDIEFTVQTKEVDESYPASMPANDIAAYLCEKKADAFTIEELDDDFLLITADTIVVVNQHVLNKPLTRQEAIEMLGLLSGVWHTVITGVCLRCKNKKLIFSESSDVKFATLSPTEIEWYVDRYQPFDKAGAYGIQEWIGYVAIESVVGSFYNVMGLPTHRLYAELKSFLCE